jgi:hypothetical protein
VDSAVVSGDAVVSGLVELSAPSPPLPHAKSERRKVSTRITEKMDLILFFIM